MIEYVPRECLTFKVPGSCPHMWRRTACSQCLLSSADIPRTEADRAAWAARIKTARSKRGIRRMAAARIERPKRRNLDEIRAAYERGLSQSEIAKALNTSQSTISRALKPKTSRPGVPPRITIEQAIEARARGLSNRQIAAEFGVSRGPVETRFKQARERGLL